MTTLDSARPDERPEERPPATQGTDLGARADGLAAAVAAGRGRLDDAMLDDVEGLAERTLGRLKLSAEHTVVAIAGATGSGKSTTFNALAGLELSSTGVRRPTTSWATACVWGAKGAAELLEWLGIPRRHQTMRDSMLDTPREERDFEGVVLLDLPDHDSTEVAHHLEVDRLVELADLMVWVLDPQKYADAAIHDRYLAPLASHAGVMVVVLNHIDTVPEDRRESMIADVRRLLDADGLQEVPVYAVSARHGTGIDELSDAIAERVRAKQLTRDRIESDLRAAAGRVAEATGTGKPRELTERQVGDLDDALADAAGVPAVVDAVERSVRLRAGRATTWPPLALASRFESDPLARAGVDLGDAAGELLGRSSAPAVAPVHRAQVDTDVRRLADDASAGLAAPWVSAVHEAATARLPELGDRLDAALADTDLGVSRLPGWAGLVRVIQWLLLLTAVGGGVWSVVAALGTGLGETPQVAGVALPLVLLVGGLVLGLVLAVGCRPAVARTAARRAEAADERLRAALHTVAQDLVVAPVATELDAYATVRRSLEPALR